MKRAHLISILVGMVVMGVFAADASAMFHPGIGGFMQRDPGAGSAMRIGGGSAAPVGEFIPRDPAGQYADGMNLHQYVRSNPITGIDPQGLARLQYSYIGIWVDGYSDYSGRDVRENKAATQLLENDVKVLLWAYGINAWRTGKGMHKDELFVWSKRIVEKHTFSQDTIHDYSHMEWQSEWQYAGNDSLSHYGTAGDIIIFVPGYIGWNGKQMPTWGAAHDPNTHVIGVPRANYTPQPRRTKVIWLAHEILHHFLKEDIRSNLGSGDERAHDSEGIMHFSAEGGVSDKLGCKTVEALKRAGVTDDEIDKTYVKGAKP